MNGAVLNSTNYQQSQPTGDESTGFWLDDPSFDEEVAPVRRARRAREVERQRNRRMVQIQLILTVVFALLLASLLLIGRNFILDLPGGPGFSSVTDPTAPGYRAEVTPTPVLLALLADNERGLASAALLIQDPAGGGTVVPLATDLLVPTDEPLTDVALGSIPDPAETRAQAPIDELFRSQGPEIVAERLGVGLGFAVQDFAIVTETEAAEVFSESGEVTIDNPSDLVDAAGVVIHPAGPTTLAPDEVVEFLGPVDPSEIAPNRVLRSQLVWEELLDARAEADGATSTSDPGIAVAGDAGADELEVGFGPFVAAIARGPHRTSSVPIDRLEPGPTGTADRYWISRWRVPEFVSKNVPLPQSAVPGQRLRAVLLNGTGDPSLPASLTADMVAYGMEIVRVGNADSLNLADSMIRYVGSDERSQSVATLFGAEFDMGVEPLDDSTGIDIQVVVGGDRQ